MNEYDLTSAFDVSPLAMQEMQVFYIVQVLEAFQRDYHLITMVPKMLVNNQNGIINEYSLITAFDVSTSSYVQTPFCL